MAKITTEALQEVFERVKSPLDTWVPLTSWDNRLADKTSVKAALQKASESMAIIGAVGRMHFNAEPHNRTIVVRVFEDGTFDVPSCACANRLEAIAAYSRAYKLLSECGLTEAP